MTLNETIEASRKSFEDWQSKGGKWPKAHDRDTKGAGAYLAMMAALDWIAWCKAIEYTYNRTMGAQL